MTVAVEQEKEMAEFGSEINSVNPSDYSCQILLEKTTLEAANDKTFPNDARLVWYVVGGIEYIIDLTRCTKTSKLFDMYYDKYGPGAVQKLILDTVQSTQNFGESNQRKKRRENE